VSSTADFSTFNDLVAAFNPLDTPGSTQALFVSGNAAMPSSAVTVESVLSPAFLVGHQRLERLEQADALWP
jgi:hypothetical protein